MCLDGQRVFAWGQRGQANERETARGVSLDDSLGSLV